MSFMVKGTLKITDLEAVKMAAQMMGMVVEVRTNYKAHHDRNDAVLVLRCSDKQIEEIKAKTGYTCPYELGIVANGDGTYSLSYDEWNRGFGLQDVIGDPVFINNQKQLAPKFSMFYNMASDMIEAKANGDEIEFQRMPDGSYQSITNTQARVGI